MDQEDAAPYVACNKAHQLPEGSPVQSLTRTWTWMKLWDATQEEIEQQAGNAGGTTQQVSLAVPRDERVPAQAEEVIEEATAHAEEVQ